MLVRIKKSAYDKHDQNNVLAIGDLVEVADEKRAKAMLEKGIAEEVVPKKLAEAAKEVVKENVAATRRSKAVAENKE